MLTTVIVIVVVAVLVLVALALAARARKHQQLRGTFGSEYDRTIDEAGSKRAAAKELADRKARHDELEISPLDPTTAQRYRDQWRLVQEQFVDAPAESVASAHTLLREALSTRGYPTRDEDERVAMLSVDHADVLDRYRQGMATEQRWRDSGTTDTEELRLAMQHYRSVFDRVVGETADADAAYPADRMTDPATSDADQRRR
jgi:hypothetical protein